MNIKKIRFYCNKILPLVYDDSLSYYEVLCKVTAKINEIIDTGVGISVADPVEWNITSQYPQNVIVIDNEGTAYISKQPVPTGVELDNENYWMPIFNYGGMINDLRSTIASNEGNSETATAPRTVGDLVYLQGVLYKVTADMGAGTRYIEGTNCVVYTVSDRIKDIVAEIAEIQGNIDAEADARESADNTLQGNIDAEARARESADDTLQDNIDALNTELSELETRVTSGLYYNVLDYGAVGDGVTDDTAAIQAAITAAETNGGGTVFIPHKTKYKVTQTLTMSGKSYILGEGMVKIESSASPVFRCYGWYGGLDNLILTGNGSNSAILLDTLHVNAQIPFIWRFQHLELNSFVNAIYDNSDGDATHYVVDIMVFDVWIRRNYGNSIDIKRSRGFMTFRNVKVDNTYNDGHTPYIGFKFNDVIGLELEMCDVVTSGKTNSQEYLPNQCAYQIIGSGEGFSSIWLKRCVFDSGLGRGFYIEGINMVQMFECECYGTFGVCMQLNNLQYLLIANSIIMGARNNSIAPSDVRGIVCSSVNKAVICNTHIWNIKGIGMMYFLSSNICNSNMYLENCETGVWCNSGNILNSNVIINNCNTPRAVNANCHFVNSYIDGVYELNS